MFKVDTIVLIIMVVLVISRVHTQLTISTSTPAPCYGDVVTLVCHHPELASNPGKYFSTGPEWRENNGKVRAIDGTIYTEDPVSSTQTFLNINIAEDHFRNKSFNYSCELVLADKEGQASGSERSEEVTVDPVDQLPIPVNTATSSNSTTAVLTVSFDPQCCNTVQLDVDIIANSSNAIIPMVHSVDSTDPTNTTIVITDGTKGVCYTASIKSVCRDANSLLGDSGVLVVNFTTYGPPEVTITTTDSTITLTWNTTLRCFESEIFTFVVIWNEIGSGTSTNVTTSSSPYTISGLQPGTSYQISVLVVGGSGVISRTTVHNVATFAEMPTEEGDSTTVVATAVVIAVVISVIIHVAVVILICCVVAHCRKIRVQGDYDTGSSVHDPNRPGSSNPFSSRLSETCCYTTVDFESGDPTPIPPPPVEGVTYAELVAVGEKESQTHGGKTKPELPTKQQPRHNIEEFRSDVAHTIIGIGVENVTAIETGGVSHFTAEYNGIHFVVTCVYTSSDVKLKDVGHVVEAKQVNGSTKGLLISNQSTIPSECLLKLQNAGCQFVPVGGYGEEGWEDRMIDKFKDVFPKEGNNDSESEDLPTPVEETSPQSCIIQTGTAPAPVQYNNSNNNNIVDKGWTVPYKHCVGPQEEALPCHNNCSTSTFRGSEDEELTTIVKIESYAFDNQNSEDLSTSEQVVSSLPPKCPPPTLACPPPDYQDGCSGVTSDDNKVASYSHVRGKDVIKSFRWCELRKDIEDMLTKSRVDTLEKDYNLIDSPCNAKIEAQLTNGDPAAAATTLLEYFKKTHSGDDLLQFCKFLRDEAKEVKRSAKLKNLADRIESVVKNLQASQEPIPPPNPPPVESTGTSSTTLTGLVPPNPPPEGPIGAPPASYTGSSLTSYSHIKAADVVQKIGKVELIKKFTPMLTDQRTVLLEARDLIDSNCRDSIQAKLRTGQRAGAATELVEYFEADHDGDKMMEFCTFLEDQAGNTSPQLVQLANTIRECVETLSVESHPPDEHGSPGPKRYKPSGDSKESDPGKGKEERAAPQDSLHTEVKRALEKGAVDVKVIKCVTLGPPEAGKTQLKHALLGDFTPIKKSTDASTQATPAVEIMVAGEKKWEPLNFKQLQSAMQTAATKEDLPQRPTKVDTRSESQNHTQSSNQGRIPEDHTPADVNPLHKDDPSHKDDPLESKSLPSQATYIDQFRNLKGKVMEAILRSQSNDANLNIHRAKLIYTVDSGGQPSFLDFHPVTATFAATYLLLYNMEEGLDAKPKMTYRKDYPTIDLPNSSQSNLEIVRRSLFTLHHFKERYREKHERLTSLMQDNFKPPRDDPYIIVVGTRRNEATLKEDKKILKSEYTRIPSVMEVVRTHFVDSLKRDSKEIEDLRSLVCTDANSCSFRLPLSWFQLHLMCLASESRTVPEPIPGNLTFSELRTVCLEEELVGSGDEFKAMVTIFHSLGVFSCPDLDLEEKEVEDSEILVFINPGLLFANVTKILEISFRAFDKPSLVNLQLSGELTTKALEDLGIPDTLGSYQRFHKRLLKWLVHWGLAAEIEEEEKWFVPSVLRPRLNPSESAISKTPFEPFPLSICFLQESSNDFTFHYLPEGLFPHFIVQLMKIGYILPKNTVEEDPEVDEYTPRTRCRDSVSLRSKRKNKPTFNIDLIDKASHLVVDLTPAKKKLLRQEAYSEAAAILAELKEAIEKANKHLYHHNSDNVAICCTCTCDFEEDHLAEVQEQRCEICCLHPKRLQQGAWEDDCDDSLKEVIKRYQSYSDKSVVPSLSMERTESLSTSSILETKVRAYEGYQAILRNHVTNKAGRNWQALSDNLGVAVAKRESLLASNHGDPNNALADVLAHWATAIPTVEATWSKLLEAMSNSSMVGPAEDLEEVLLKGIS